MTPARTLAVDQDADIAGLMRRLGADAKAAAATLATAPSEAKDRALLAAAEALRETHGDILVRGECLSLLWVRAEQPRIPHVGWQAYQS